VKIGSNYLGDGRCEFTVWAPSHEEIAVQIVSPENRLIPMQKDEQGYFKVLAEGIDQEHFISIKLPEMIDPIPRLTINPRMYMGLPLWSIIAFRAGLTPIGLVFP
jgi:maltooligosyltrehalose trehalohydrolase